MLKKLNWEIYTNKERITVIGQIKTIIAANGGHIMAHNMFSDLALFLSVEIEEQAVYKLYQQLNVIATVSKKISASDFKINSNKEWMVLMNITFAQGTGKMKSRIPEVPG